MMLAPRLNDVGTKAKYGWHSYPIHSASRSKGAGLKP